MSDDSDPMVYATFETTFSREEHEEQIGADDTEQTKKVENKGKHLMLFNDRSGSMSGTPFESLKKGCLEIADSIFAENENNPDDNPFEMVHTVFYGSDATVYSTNKKSQYINNVKNSRVYGGTNFGACYEVITNHIRTAPAGAEFYIFFMTDGCDGGGNLGKQADMTALMKKL